MKDGNRAAKARTGLSSRAAAQCSFFWHFMASAELLLITTLLKTGNSGISKAHTAEEVRLSYSVPFTFSKLKIWTVAWVELLKARHLNSF